jgi:riboflavin synthase
MFTGIIEDWGKVLRVEYLDQERKLVLELPPHLTDVQLGDSININGVCLTVVQKGGQAIKVDLSPETLQRTTLAEVKEGERVNLERALKLSDRLGGHIVMGHIDGIGVITGKWAEGNAIFLKIRVPLSVSKYVVQKGSIAIDGISLTVNACEGEDIQVTLIPYTVKKTTLIERKVGDRVNMEADILGKYIEKMLGRKSEGPMDLSFLREHGFIND